MTKQAKLLLALSGIAFLLIFYLFFTSTPVTIKQTNYQPTARKAPAIEAPIDLVKLEANYKANVRKALLEYDQILAEAGLDTEDSLLLNETSFANGGRETLAIDLAELKISLMDLRVPKEFRDLHVDLVLSLSYLKQALENQDDFARSEGLAMLRGARSEYSWLSE
ncbi:MAG: hypothetical protein KAJ48_05050 [Elusimicrobiales bacterium]|nr:hypothetical protein [Elusimicrobiales bacterium]